MKVLSMREFMLAEKVNVVPMVRANASGYTYITFVKEGAEKGTGGMNVYFSKNAEALVAEGQVVNKEFMAPFKLGWVEYADEREARWKVITQSESTWLGADDFA